MALLPSLVVVNPGKGITRGLRASVRRLCGVARLRWGLKPFSDHDGVWGRPVCPAGKRGGEKVDVEFPVRLRCP